MYTFWFCYLKYLYTYAVMQLLNPPIMQTLIKRFSDKKKRKKKQGAVLGNVLLIRKIRREWSDWFELMAQIITLYNLGVQRKHLRTHTTLNYGEDHIRFDFFPSMTIFWGYYGHRVIETTQMKVGKALPGV